MMAVKQVQTRALMRDVLGESDLSFELRGVEQGEDLVDGRLLLHRDPREL